jgi:hypothetical protein
MHSVNVVRSEQPGTGNFNTAGPLYPREWIMCMGLGLLGLGNRLGHDACWTMCSIAAGMGRVRLLVKVLALTQVQGSETFYLPDTAQVRPSRRV